MEVSIKAKQPLWWFTSGKHVEVTVRTTDDEARAMETYDLYSVSIIDGEPTSASEETDNSLRIRTFDSVYYFRDFCGGVTSWHAESDEDARQFIVSLEKGFLHFHKLLDAKLREQAAAPKIVSMDDVAKDLLYKHYTKKPDDA